MSAQVNLSQENIKLNFCFLWLAELLLVPSLIFKLMRKQIIIKRNVTKNTNQIVKLCNTQKLKTINNKSKRFPCTQLFETALLLELLQLFGMREGQINY